MHTSFNVSDRSYLAIVKRDIHRLAVSGGFDQKKLNEIDLLVAEIGSNLVKHAVGGELLAALVGEEGEMAIELIGIDNGPGINQPEKMMLDGMSTTQTLGHGLGSIRRLSDSFELYSKKDWGTILLSRVYASTPPLSSRNPVAQIRSLIVAKPGETVSGDGCFSMKGRDGTIRLLAADGLGHGKEANIAVQAAIEAFRHVDSDSPSEILRHIHAAIRRTRGMVGTAVILDPVKRIWKFCGVGNISCRFIGFQEFRSYLSNNGIIGHNMPNTLNDQELSYEDYQQIILCSDGLKSRWEHARLLPMNKHDLMIQAAAIYKDYARKTDDMSILIGRILT